MMLLLTLLAEEVAYKGAIHSDMCEKNHFYTPCEKISPSRFLVIFSQEINHLSF
jgi:hypothetical protein